MISVLCYMDCKNCLFKETPSKPNHQSSFSIVMRITDEGDRGREEKKQDNKSQSSLEKPILEEEQVDGEEHSLNEIQKRVEALRTSGKLEQMFHRIGVDINGHFEEDRKHSW